MTGTNATPVVGQAALARVDAIVATGTTNEWELQYLDPASPPVPVDLTGWTARAEIRDRIGGSVWATLDTFRGTITLDAVGNVVLRFTAPASTWAGRNLGVWDLVLSDPSGTDVRLVSGQVSVSHSVTW